MKKEDEEDRVLTDLLGVISGLTRAYALTCIAVALLTMTFLSVEKDQRFLDDLRAVRELARATSSSAREVESQPRGNRTLEEDNLTLIALAIGQVTGVKATKDEPNPVLTDAVKAKVSLRCPDGDCPLICKIPHRPPSLEGGSVADWLTFFDSHGEYHITDAKTGLVVESSYLTEYIIGPNNNRFVLDLSSCATLNTDASSAVVTVMMQFDGGSVSEEVVSEMTLGQPLAFVAERQRDARIEELHGELARLQLLDKGLRSASFAEATKELETRIKDASTTVEIAGVSVDMQAFTRWMAWFIVAFSVYLALYFQRLFSLPPPPASMLRGLTWFPLFPGRWHLYMFIVGLFALSVVATRPDLLAAIGQLGGATPDNTYLLGVFGGAIVSYSALCGFTAIRTNLDAEASPSEPPPGSPPSP